MRGKDEIKQHMTRADFLLIGGCILAAAVFGACFFIGKRPGRTLQLSCGGKVVEILSLDAPGMSEKPVYYLIYEDEGQTVWERFETPPEMPEGVGWYNLLSVSDSGVSMAAADCPDQICVNHIPISTEGESIICLPHKFVAEIVGGKSEDRLDGMVK